MSNILDTLTEVLSTTDSAEEKDAVAKLRREAKLSWGDNKEEIREKLVVLFHEALTSYYQSVNDSDLPTGDW